MSSGDFIETVERFFLDFIGTVVPGFALICGCCYVSKTDPKSFCESLAGSTDSAWIYILGAAFVLGHGLTAFSYQITTKWVEVVASWPIGQKLLPFVQTEPNIEQKLKADPIFRAFCLSAIKKIPSMRDIASQSTKLRVWRNLAISLIQKDNQVIYRFTFIALLNLGIASAIAISLILWVSLWGLAKSGWSVSVREVNASMPIAAFAGILFLERFYAFNRRAIQVPFSMALVRLDYQEINEQSKAPAFQTGNTGGDGVGREINVYLAGGFKSGWQDNVKLNVPKLRYLDPRSHGLTRSAEYTAWDLTAVRRCDCVFAYLEASNPAGYALALEIGFARALGKFVILVDDKSRTSDEMARHLEMLGSSADIVFPSLEEGRAFLEKYQTTT